MRYLVTLLLLFSTGALAAPEDDLAAMTKTLPRDMLGFIGRKADCHHWAGEEPYDAARVREIERAISKLKCETADAEEAALKRRYANDARAIKAFAVMDEVYQ